MNYTCTSPVLLLAFNRPEETLQVFNAIKKVRPKQLFIAVDGPRADNENDLAAVSKIYSYVDLVDWDCDVKTLFRDKNLGCKNAIASGIDWFFVNVERGIILEDDCLPGGSFFRFCDELLEKYQDDLRVMQISGSNFLEGLSEIDASYYFCKLNDIWGWATWRRAWNNFDLEMKGFDAFAKYKKIYDYFDDVKCADWMFSYLEESASGKSSVWSTQWSYSMIKENALTIAPVKNLVINLGLEGGGVNIPENATEFKKFNLNEIVEIKHPADMLANKEADSLRYKLIVKTDPRLLFKVRLRKFIHKLLKS